MVALRRLGVFCGSSSGRGDEHRELAEELGRLAAERGIELVYGGGQVGLMGVVADACLAAGGLVTGVIPVGLFAREVAHPGVTRLVEVTTMHERKRLMYELSDAFTALPGGLGTLEELAEVATWNQLGLHGKPMVLLDTGGFWDALVAQLDHMVAEGFLKPAHRLALDRCRSPVEALDRLAAAEPVGGERWVRPEER